MSEAASVRSETQPRATTARGSAASARAEGALSANDREVPRPPLLAGEGALAHGERVGVGGQGEVLVLGVDGVAAVGAVPLGDGGVGLHLLEDVPPAGAGVVGAEADLPELGAVGDDAHLGAAEVVVEEVLEPHAGDEEGAPLVVPGVVLAAVGGARLAQELLE